MNPAIFRDYDVRGVYPNDLTPEAAKRIGYAFAKFVSQKSRTRHPNLLIARDTRASSDILRQNLIEGVLSYGAHVHDMGIATTPQFYFSVETRPDMDGAVIITASHNPPEYNGFKFVLAKHGEIGAEEGLNQVKKFVLAGKFKHKPYLGGINLLTREKERYLKALKRLVPKIEPLRALIDAGGGTVSFMLPELLSHYPIFYKPLFFNPDPMFAGHIPNPLSPEVEKIMVHESKRGNYRIGMSFDGDGDRVSFFDERGKRIRDDIIFALLASEALTGRRGLNFVFELTQSRFLGPYIAAHGGILHTSKVGGVHVRSKMKEAKAVLGGEISAHIYHGDMHNIDSGLLTMLKVLRLVSSFKKPLSQIVGSVSRSTFHQFEIRLKNPARVLKILERKHKKHISSKLDGLSVQYPSWWFNIRMSRTEPILRLTIEADTEHEMQSRWREIEKLVK
ncbi:MAG: hypothetical protein HYT39_00080 [Candidatus Sungbacteria bacterium]|nr:hypothetical protein [Candidatus Sungbacteria bacterium]